jgi:two-component system, LuxR family, sensor kinase FixL
MTRDSHAVVLPPTSGNVGVTSVAGPAAESVAQPAALHGRLLDVSRMATVGEMAAGVAHELNQPLTAIANYPQACVRLLGRPDVNPATLRDALTEITSQAARAADIIRRLRALAVSQQGPRAQANINALVREIVDLVDSDARLHRVRLTLDLVDDLPHVVVDAGQIQHVILNFVRNSLEALDSRPPDTGRLVIRTSLTAEHEVELAVIDNGPGLAPETIQRLFEPFFSTKESGTGMGLATSNTIARVHGGSVGFRPNQDAGACFFLRLPCPSAP